MPRRHHESSTPSARTIARTPAASWSRSTRSPAAPPRSRATPPTRSPAASSAARSRSISTASTHPTACSTPCAANPACPKARCPQGARAESFERISWDEALDEIAARLPPSPPATAPRPSCPTAMPAPSGQLGYGSMDRRFFHRLGASQLDRTICATAGGEACLTRLRPQARHRTAGLRPRPTDPRVGRQHPRQQHPPVAVHRGGTSQRRPTHRHRPLLDPHRGARRPASRHQSWHGHRAGSRHDARHRLGKACMTVSTSPSTPTDSRLCSSGQQSIRPTQWPRLPASMRRISFGLPANMARRSPAVIRMNYGVQR